MNTDENANEQTVKKTDAQTFKDEQAPQEYSLVQPLPKPDPALRNYAEASEEIDSDNVLPNSICIAQLDLRRKGVEIN